MHLVCPRCRNNVDLLLQKLLRVLMAKKLSCFCEILSFFVLVFAELMGDILLL